MPPSTPSPTPIVSPAAEGTTTKKLKMPAGSRNVLIIATIAVIVIGGAAGYWFLGKPSGPGIGFISGNGRIEATDIDVSTKLAGRVLDILVIEGDVVKAEQPLAHMQIDVLDAQRAEARAQSQQAITAVASAVAQAAANKSDKAAAEAGVVERESEMDAAQRRFARLEPLSKVGAVGIQETDDARAALRGAQAALNGAIAQVAAAQSAIEAADAQVVGAHSGVTASEATIARIEADIQDSQLTSPRDGRIQYRVAEPGEVLPAGGKVLNLVDLGDVYMTFFLPESAAGKVAMGTEVRIVLDAAPQYVIPATISYVASTAQFTPKSVETAVERQKLMFRVKAQIGRDLLQKNLKMVKTGLPGVAWIKLDAKTDWPANLQVKVPE